MLLPSNSLFPLNVISPVAEYSFLNVKLAFSGLLTASIVPFPLSVNVTVIAYSLLSYVILASFPATSFIVYFFVAVSLPFRSLNVYSIFVNVNVPSLLLLTLSSSSPSSFNNTNVNSPSLMLLPSNFLFPLNVISPVAEYLFVIIYLLSTFLIVYSVSSIGFPLTRNSTTLYSTGKSSSPTVFTNGNPAKLPYQLFAVDNEIASTSESVHLPSSPTFSCSLTVTISFA